MPAWLKGTSEYKTQPPCKSSLYFYKQPLKAILHRFFPRQGKSAFGALDIGSRVCHNPCSYNQGLFCVMFTIDKQQIWIIKSADERRARQLSQQNSSWAIKVGVVIGSRLVTSLHNHSGLSYFRFCWPAKLSEFHNQVNPTTVVCRLPQNYVDWKLKFQFCY